MDTPENIELDKDELINNIDKRIRELENYIENDKMDIVKYKNKYDKTFEMRYAEKVILSGNRVIKNQKKIEKYKTVRLKYV